MRSKGQTGGKEMIEKAAGVILFISWLLCGCCVETICDDWRACVVFVIALIVAILAAVTVLAKYNDK
jgi:hypothetical protein